MRERFFVGMVLLLSFSGCWGEPSSEVSTPFPNVAWEEETIETEDAAETVPFEETFFKDLELGYSGTLALTGYVSIDTVACAFQMEEDCMVSMARFHYDRPDNDAFRQFVEEYEGNSFVSSSSLSLGCFESTSSEIQYVNASDTDLFDGTIDGELFEKLMATRDQSRTVQLFMEKPALTQGAGAPDCYSHFRNFQLIPE